MSENDPGATQPYTPFQGTAADSNGMTAWHEGKARPGGRSASGAVRNPEQGVLVPAVTALAVAAVASTAVLPVPGAVLKVVVWLAVAVIGLALTSVVCTLAASRKAGSADQAPPEPEP